jgi:hypothetical protein
VGSAVPVDQLRVTRRRRAPLKLPGVRNYRDEKNGAQGRSRTADTAIFSRMLYQLSYLGISGDARKRAL